MSQPDTAQPDTAQPVRAAKPERMVSKAVFVIFSALLATIVVLAGVLVWLLVSTVSTQGAEDARRDAPIAAAAQVKAIFSFNHATVRDEMAKVLAGTTGDFHKQFETEINDSVIPNAEETEAVAIATVISQGTVRAGDDSATVLVFVNRTVTANTGPKATSEPIRLLVDMEKVDGIWKVSGLDSV